VLGEAIKARSRESHGSSRYRHSPYDFREVLEKWWGSVGTLCVGCVGPLPETGNQALPRRTGAIHEQFVDEVSDHAGRAPWEADMAKVLSVAPKYGVEFATPTGTD
jgi:hypothetical protein